MTFGLLDFKLSVLSDDACVVCLHEASPPCVSGSQYRCLHSSGIPEAFITVYTDVTGRVKNAVMTTVRTCLQSYRKAVSTARRDKKGARAAGLTEEQKQEIRCAVCT